MKPLNSLLRLLRRTSFSRQLATVMAIAVVSLAVISSLAISWQTSRQISANLVEQGRQVTENDLEPLILRRYLADKDNSAALLFEAMLTVEKITRQMALLQERYDVLLSPTLTKPPVEIGKLSLNQDNAAYEAEAISVSAFPSLYNATGQPAMSVPLHWTADGLPVGVMFAGRYGEETLLYQLAGQLEQAQPWFGKLPPL